MKLTYRHTLRACYTGSFTQAIVNNLAPLLFVLFQEDYGLSFEQVGRLILINFGVQLLTDVFCVNYVDRIGYRRSMVAAHVFAASGLVLLAVLPRVLASPYVGLIIAVITYAVGGGLLEVLVSPIVDALPSDCKEASMSLLHSFYCWGQVTVVAVSTLFLFAFGGGTWPILPLIWMVVPLCNAVLFAKVPLVKPQDDVKMMSVPELLRSRVFVLALVLMLCAGASELSMSQWASLFAQKGLHVPKVLGDLLGPCLFAVLMGAGRMLYGLFGTRLNLKNVLSLCGALCVVCYLTTVFSPWPMLSLLGCAVSGLSVSLMWPGTFSLMSARNPLGGTAMFGMMAVFGDLGCSLGPWVTGLVSDFAQRGAALPALAASIGMDLPQFGLKCGLLIAVVFPLVLLLGVAALKKS